jgi:tetratricopeptide (TPR) repeat protein
LTQAAGRVDDAGADGLRGHLEQAQADLDMENRLEDIWLKMACQNDKGRFAWEQVAAEYEETFRKAGFGMGGEEAAVADRVRGSALRDQLVAALGAWAALTPDGPAQDRLLWIAGSAGRDPTGLIRLRDPAVRRNRRALERLADEAAASEWSPRELTVLSDWLERAGGDSEQLLRAGQRKFPTDAWVNTKLGALLDRHGKSAEAVGFHRAALAVQPESSPIHANLAVTLLDAGQPEEALVAADRAIELDRTNVMASNYRGNILLVQKRFEEALAAHRRALEIDPRDATSQLNVGVTLHAMGRLEEAATAYRRAIELFPRFAMAHTNLGNLLYRQGRLEEALAAQRRAIEAAPEIATPHYNLGVQFQEQGRLDEAVAEFRRAAELDPSHAPTQNNLGNNLRALGQRDEAEAALRRATELDPRHARAHYNLGRVLEDRGWFGEALAEYRRAVELDPKLATAHTNLGHILYDQGRRAEALASYHRAIEADPKLAMPHFNLGVHFQQQGRPGEALAEYRRAAELDPKMAAAHTNLGNLLLRQGRLDEAGAALRRAVELDPKLAIAHNALGNLLHSQGQVEESIAAFRRATEADPRYVEAHHNLGNVLLLSGRLKEASAAYRRASELAPRDAGVGANALRQLKECERLLALEARLPAILAGGEQSADAPELRELAWLCQCSQRHHAAARFYAAAFAALPKVADDLRTQERYSAACAAALAAAGQGTDAGKLGTKERASLRRQALAWLSSDLAAWAKLVKDSPQERPRARQVLQHWQTGSDLSGLRDAGALAGLPPEEQAACRRFWAGVEALLQQAKP